MNDPEETEETETVNTEAVESRTLSVDPSADLTKASVSDRYKSERKSSENVTKEVEINKRPIKEKIQLPDDFYYDYNEVISQPRITAESGLPANVIQLVHSFGYNSRKRDNLALLDQSTLCFISGNYVQFLNVNDLSQKYMRSLTGGGIGCLAVNLNRKYLAIGEKDSVKSPFVAIYEYPSLRLYRILREGTERGYSSCKFNVEGDLLATVGSNPDYMLTVWDWKNEQIVLRCKAFSQQVHRVLWSFDLEGILATGGAGHIRFWKMADSFTGLKLQGDLGKFGKTQISDIEGFVIFPDGKVLSGSEWGNMLMWDGELIKVQIGCKNKKSCHVGHINQIINEDSEIITVGADGKIKTWDLETLDSADVLQEMAIFEMQPMNELEVSSDAKLMHIVRSSDKESAIWYAQDANGRIWKLDLSFTNTSMQPEFLATFHSGEIKDCDTSPISYLSTSIGAHGEVRVYDFAAKKMMAEYKFNVGGSKLLWAPISVDPKGKTIIAGFEDGVIRILNFTDLLESELPKKPTKLASITLIQAIKPHTKKVTVLCVDKKGKILVTGSDDETVFFLSISSPEFFPIGFVKFDKKIIHIEWIERKSEMDNDNSIDCIVIFMDGGTVAEVVCPDPSTIDQSETFEMREIKPIITYSFMSIKSRLRHAEDLIKKEKEYEEEQENLRKERLIRLNNGTETEEEQQREIEEEAKLRQAELESAEEFIPFIPVEPSPIYCGFVDKADKNKFWLSMGGYDSGYIYQCQFAQIRQQKYLNRPDDCDEPILSPILEDSDDIPVTCLKWSNSGKRLLMGLENGSIRLQNVNIPFDINTMSSNWQSSMHDNNYGSITSLCFSYDEKFLISVGKDGNYFVYEVMDEDLQSIEIEAYLARLPSDTIPVIAGDIEDILDHHAYSIEEHKQRSEFDRNAQLAAIKKAATLKKIKELQKEFKLLQEHNSRLPENNRLNSMVFDLVPQLRADLIKMRDEQIELTHKKMAFESERCRIALEKMEKRFREPLESDHMEVHAIESGHMVSTIRGCNLSDEYFRVFDEIERIKRDILEKNISRCMTRTETVNYHEDDEDGPTNIEDGLNKCDLKGARGMRIVRQLRKLVSNRQKRKIRKAQWNLLYSEKPAHDYEDPTDVAAIYEATHRMGDFKLKCSKHYVVDEKDRPSAMRARHMILAIANQTFQMRSDFNKKVYGLKDMKLKIIQSIKLTNAQIDKCNLLTGDRVRKHFLDISYYPEEFPEKKFQFTKEALLNFKKELELRKKTAILDDDSSKPNVASVSKIHQETGMRTTKVNRPHHSIKKVPFEDTSVVADSLSNIKITYSLRQIEEQNIRNFRTVHCTDFMISVTQKQIRVFDASLKLLRHEKYNLSMGLRRALLRQLILFEEYRLLKMYEWSERGLIVKTEEKTLEKMDISIRITELQGKIDAGKKEIERLLDRDRVTFERFKDTLGDNNKFAEYLHKVYKKKIKRKKKDILDISETNDSSDSDDSDLDESDDEEDDEDAVAYDLDMCPPGCNQELYDSTCQLREVRLDVEDFLLEERKNHEILKKDIEAYAKKSKVIKSALTQAENELEAFQFEKQQKLNQLNTIVVLKLHQVLHNNNSHLPKNMEDSLVIEASTFTDLKERIKLLLSEQATQTKISKQLKTQHKRLQKNRELFKRKIMETQVECNDRMITRFGKLGNLEKMEKILINPRIEELTYKMMELQNQMCIEQSKWEDRIHNVQEMFVDEVKVKSCNLDNIHLLFTEKRNLIEELDSKQNELGAEFKNSDADMIKELNNLHELTLIQVQELYSLRTELGMLMRKGGHVLPPVSYNCKR